MADSPLPAGSDTAPGDEAGRRNGDAARPRPVVPVRPAAEANPNLLRDRLANERTFLAWLRTGIAVASLGFVVARFDIFLQQLARVTAQPGSGEQVKEATKSQVAIPIGVVLIIAGPVMVLLAAIRYLHTERALHLGRPDSRRLVRSIVVAITIVSAIAGGVLTLHVIALWPT